MERLGAADALFYAGHYGECIYVAGLAVECTLRAHLVRRDPEFDSRHDLRDLLKASGLSDLVPESQRRRLTICLAEIWARWRNSYRFLPAAELKADLHRRGLLHRLKGDPLKANARRLLDCSRDIVGMGYYLWRRS